MLQAVEGNVALALLLTTGTNLLGIATVPFLMYTLLGTGDLGGVLDPVQLLVSLIKTILVPLLLGATARALVPGKLWLAGADASGLAAVLD